jgi:hypothetical protein
MYGEKIEKQSKKRSLGNVMKILCSNYQYFLLKNLKLKDWKKIGVTFNSSSWMFKCKGGPQYFQSSIDYKKLFTN